MTERIGSKLIVKGDEPWFELEESGVKPNTVRRMTDSELQDARMATTIEIVNYDRLAARRFERTITGVYDVTGYVKPQNAGHVVIICWEATR